MHRTEGLNNVDGLFTDSPPATTITAAWLNAVQEEIINAIEDSGQAVNTRQGDTHNQLSKAISLLGRLFYEDSSAEIYLQIMNLTTGTLETDGILFGMDSSENAVWNNQENTDTKIISNGTEKQVITPAGIITNPLQSASRVYLSANQTIPNGVQTIVQFNTKDYDIQTEFNTGTYKFTVTTAGLYLISWHTYLNVATVTLASQFGLSKNGAFGLLLYGRNVYDLVGEYIVNLTGVFSLSVGDTVYAEVYFNTVNNILNGGSSYETSLSIHKLS